MADKAGEHRQHDARQVGDGLDPVAARLPFGQGLDLGKGLWAANPGKLIDPLDSGERGVTVENDQSHGMGGLGSGYCLP